MISIEIKGERMGMGFRFLAIALLLSTLGLVSCGTTNSTTASSGTGILYLTTQGDKGISAYSVNLGNGVIATIGKEAATGNVPSSVVLAGNAAFVANSQDGNISSFTLNSDGTLTAVSGTQAAGVTPMGMSTDSAGKFLFVANQGTFGNPASGTVSVYTISGTTLATVPGSPFSTGSPGVLTGTGPVSVAVTPKASFAYVANQFTNTVSGFSVASSGALTKLPGSPYPVGISPSAVAITPDGNFLYIANTGSNTISAFAICANASVTCVTPDGSLTPVTGSPFSAGVGPVSIAADTSGKYLFVADEQSNQISQYKVSTGTGVLTVQSPPAVSVGTNPVSVAVRAGSGAILGDGGTTNYVYVANTGSASISTFSYDTLTGTLTLVGGPITTIGNQPSALALK
jgi:6-phosphogluconolactonase